MNEVKNRSNLKYFRPYIFEHNVPKWAAGNKNFANIEKVAKGEKFKDEKGFKISNITSLGGVKFNGFGKLPNYGKDLYADLVAPTLKTSLRVETWQNGGNKISSTCNKTNTAMNINKISFDKSFTEPSVKFSSASGDQASENAQFNYLFKSL